MFFFSIRNRKDTGTEKRDRYRKTDNEMKRETET